jgi:hypothetical protein
MTENLEPDKKVDEEVVVEPTVEDRARDKGWRPLDEFEGDKDSWVDADEFIKREPLFKSLHKLNRENRDLRKALNDVTTMVQNIEGATRKRTMAELERKFEKAAEAGDVKGALEVRDQMKAVEAEPSPQEGSSTKDKEAVFNKWVEENSWFTNDVTLKRQANGIGSELVADRCAELGISANDLSVTDLQDIYAEVTKQVKAEFPDKFSNPARKRPTAVSDGNKRTADKTTIAGNKKTPTINDLPDDDAKAVARNLVKLKVFKSEEEYMKAYIAGAGTLKQE